MDDIVRISEVASNLKNPVKLHILNYLSDKDASNQEIFESLKNTLQIKCRSGVYNSLKDLQEAGLIKKYYDNENNKIKYKLIIKIVNIDLESMKISLFKNK